MASTQRNINIGSALELHQFMGLYSDFASKEKITSLTKVIVTIGTKTSTKEYLGRLLGVGMDVCRLNVCHGTLSGHAETIKNLREIIGHNPVKHCAVLLDVSGEIRIGRIKDKKFVLQAGSEILIGNDTLLEGDWKMISLDYPNLVEVVKTGSTIQLSDGISSFTVLSVNKDKKIVRARASTDIIIEEQKLVYIPGATLDEKGIRFGVDHDVDFIAASVTGIEDLNKVREILGEKGKNIQVIAKIGSVEALEKIDDILKHTDSVIVSRGDLGVVVPEEQVFVAQKMLVSKCNASHTPAIMATQMLYSMIRNPRPTRAECTDVANAVLDGSDAVMLSGETENGDYPIESLEMMVQICHKADQVERMADYNSLFESIISAQVNPSIAEVVASYAVRTALDLNAKLIFTITETGNTARLVCKYRPPVPVISITANPKVANRLLITRATVPFLVKSVLNTDSVVAVAIERAKKEGRVKPGDTVVAVSGDIEGVAGQTNSFKVIVVPE